MTRTHASTSLVDHAQPDELIERRNMAHARSLDAFFLMLLAEAGAISLFAAVVFGLLATL
jgi:hypothetical protein